MRLVSCDEPGGSAERLGAWVEDTIIDLPRAQAWLRGIAKLGPGLPLPQTMLDLLRAGPTELEAAAATVRHLQGEPVLNLRYKEQPIAYRSAEVRLRAPLPNPTSVRDFYAFEQHVRTARANRGLDMIPEWYEIPVFYFTNHHAIFGPDDVIQRPKASRSLDFELEVACVLNRAGRDIPAAEAEDYIAGYTIMNDWSARDLQMKEMKMNLGPAKGKDFATSLGPSLVTPDELADVKTERGYNLQMVARRNGEEISRGNWADITFSFAQMIERASADVWLYPGDVIGSGTVGTGCLLELTKGKGPWLEPGDEFELEIERLGVLRNTIG